MVPYCSATESKSPVAPSPTKDGQSGETPPVLLIDVSTAQRSHTYPPVMDKMRLARGKYSCPYCRNLKWQRTIEALPKLEDIENNVSKGVCYTCGFLLDWIRNLEGLQHAVEKREQPNSRDFMVKRLLSLYIPGRDWSLQLYLKGEKSYGRHALYLKPGTFDEYPVWGAGNSLPVVSGDTSSDTSLLWAIRTMKDCLLSHDACRQPDMTFLPSRVLDLGEPRWPKDPSLVEDYLKSDIKLVEQQVEDGPTRGIPKHYVCLSHCWGTAATSLLTTTSTNLTSHKMGIKWANLPRTFQDAVTFTRKLRIQYLWIDSLCIIQDNALDWEKEAANMASVFQNCQLTICASAALDCNHGLFVKNSPNPWSAKLVSEPWEVHARRAQIHRTLPSVSGEDCNSPLIKRAWVYQERLLAPRVLHFGDTELTWECASGTFCECGTIQTSLSPVPTGDKKSRRLYVAKISHTETLKSGAPAEIVSRWHEVVAEYSPLSLTFESDRLPALAGLVAQFQTRKPVEFRYLAGLWEDTFILDLRWCVSTHPEPVSQERINKTVPTWSWISITSGVYYRGMADILPFAKVMRIDSTTSRLHPNPHPHHQQDTRACISLLGFLIPLGISEFDYNQKYYRGMVTRLAASNSDLSSLPGAMSSFTIIVDFEWHAEGPEKITDFNELFLFPLVAGKTITSMELDCLVLKRSPGRDGVFSRVGFTYSAYHKQSLEEFKDLWTEKMEKSVVRIF